MALMHRRKVIWSHPVEVVVAIPSHAPSSITELIVCTAVTEIDAFTYNGELNNMRRNGYGTVRF